MNKNEIYFAITKTVSNGYERYRIQKQVDGHKINVTGKTKKEVTEKFYAKLDEMQRQKNFSIDVNKITFADFVKYYLYDVIEPSNTLRYSSISIYDAIYRNHILSSNLEKVKLIDTNRENLQIFINGLIERNLSTQNIKHINRFVGTVLNYAVAGDIIVKNYSKYVKIPKEEHDNENQTHKFLTDDEIKLLIENCDSYKLQMLVRLIVNTGLRINEALALTVKDVQNNVIDINKILTVNKKRELVTGPTKTKTGTRKIPINTSLGVELKKYILHIKEERFKVGILVRDDSLLFTGETFQAMRHQTITVCVNRVYKKCNIDVSGFHVLRHTFGSKLYEKGVDIKTISELLGHSNISITSEIYIHLSPESKVNALKLLSF